MTIDRVAKTIIGKYSEVPAKHSMLVGISGIDASGKGYVTDLIDQRIRSAGLRSVVINIDGWLNLPHIRFDHSDLAGNFYRNALRFDEMFDRLVLPLREDRSINVTTDFTEETATEYRKHNYRFDDIDIIVLEGIFLFKREFAELYDLKIWIECPLETALRRAVGRSQEGLDPDETIAAYEKIYFPAQVLHFETDDPIAVADFIFDNK